MNELVSVYMRTPTGQVTFELLQTWPQDEKPVAFFVECTKPEFGRIQLAQPTTAREGLVLIAALMKEVEL